MTFVKHVAIGELYNKYKERYDEMNDIDTKIKKLELELKVFQELFEKGNGNNSFVKEKIKLLEEELRDINDYLGSGKFRLEFDSLKNLLEVIKEQL